MARLCGEHRLRTPWSSVLQSSARLFLEVELGNGRPGGRASNFRGNRVPNMRNEFRFALVLVLVVLGAPGAQAQDVKDDGRVGVTFAHPTPLDDFSGAPYVWFDDQTNSVTSF